MFTVLAESYLHRLDPFAIQFTPTFGLRWYGLAYAVGFLIAWWMIRAVVRRGRSPLDPAAVGDLMFYVIAGVLVGGRLGHAIFYQGGRPLVEFGPHFPYWELLAINRGGMSAHGGILGVIAACCIFARRRGISSLHLLDLGSLACTPGLFLGRLANFVNGELWGKALPVSMQSFPPREPPVAPPWWSVKYPGEITEVWLRLAGEQDPALADASAAAAARLAELEPLRGPMAGTSDFTRRVVADVYAGDAQVTELVQPLLTAYYPSQILQAITDGPLLLGLLVLVWLKPRTPGVVGAWFLIGYGVMRVVTEVVRQPDPGVSLLLGLSRGQVLSGLMILGGAIGLMIRLRSGAAPVGGLLRPSPPAETGDA